MADTGSCYWLAINSPDTTANDKRRSGYLDCPPAYFESEVLLAIVPFRPSNDRAPDLRGQSLILTCIRRRRLSVDIHDKRGGFLARLILWFKVWFGLESGPRMALLYFSC